MICWLTLGSAVLSTSPLAGQVQKQAPATPGSSLASAIPALARGLVDDSRRLGEMIRLELGKSPQGQQLNCADSPLKGPPTDGSSRNSMPR